MNDTTFLLLIGTLGIVWWACVWGVFDMVVSFTKRPLLCYGIGIAFITAFLYQYPAIADRLI